MIAREMALALRRLLRAPLFTLFAAVSLGLGLGATTAIYSVIYFLLWRPAGIVEPDRVVDLKGTTIVPGELTGWSGFSSPDFDDLTLQQTTFSSLAAAYFFRLPVVHDGTSDVVFGEAVSNDFFRTFGVTAIEGRLIGPADNRPDAPPAAIVGERFARTKLGPGAVVGRQIKIGGQPFEIVGVVPKAFPGSRSFFMPASMWIPTAMMQRLSTALAITVDTSNRDRRWLTVKGRLQPGRTLSDASSELDLIGQRIERAFPHAGHGERRGG